MDKKNWYESREKLKGLLELKKKELQQTMNDIAEIEFCVESYLSLVGDYVPEEQPKPIGVA